MRKDDNFIDTHSFGRPIYYDEKINKSIWCFAKELESDEDYFYIYHGLIVDSIYTRVSMDRPSYINEFEEDMRKLTDDEKSWLINILSSQAKDFKYPVSNWERMVAIYKDECTAYGINISEDKKMPDYTKLK